MSEENQLNLDQHQEIGESLKECIRSYEHIKLALAFTYPKSSKREIKRLENLIASTQAMQVCLHRRLLVEQSDEAEHELLPIYLGR